jgi:lipoic acid synthetase
MLGLGETEAELIEAFKDLRNSGVDILTLGQYLQPTKKHLPVAEYVSPEDFTYYKEIALSMGFRYVESGPMVRSSYHAEKHVI